ncbi:MAG TPA: hypothetical protein VD931_08565 [Baekduia sp.]|nr:hypothetical protein [Baekduia sp.]
MATGIAVLGLLPLAGNAGGPRPLEDRRLDEALQQVGRTVDEVVARTTAPVRKAAQPAARAVNAASAPPAAARQAQDPLTEPPLHGANPHGQGSVAVIDIDPRTQRPLAGDPDGSETGEEVVVGRARGEQQADGTYHGHITIAALFGNEIVGVDTTPGQSRTGPLDPIQQNLLTPICQGSGNNVCLSLVRADSATTAQGSTNRFSTARATLGGPGGIDVGAAESNGDISDDGQCQTSRGSTTVASANAGGQAVAGLSRSATESKACKGQAPQQTNSSAVLELGGTAVPIPAAGCGTGAPDTVTGIPTLLPIVCGADETNDSQATAPHGVREALTIFTLATPTTSLLRTSTAASESRAQAPPSQCTDGKDNDGDGVADSADPGCHSDGNPNNPNSFVPADEDETDARRPGGGQEGAEERAGREQCSDGRDNDGDGLIDARDPGCHTDGNANNPASYDPDDDNEGGGAGGPQCSDGRDNDGDGRVDARDPGCHTDGNADNPASYDPDDDSEADGAGAVAGDRADRELPFTGTNVLLLLLAGVALVGAGLALRRPALGAR